MDRDAIRDGIRETLQTHDLSLDQVVWKEDLKAQTLTLSLKISGDLVVQDELPFEPAFDGRRT